MTTGALGFGVGEGAVLGIGFVLGAALAKNNQAFWRWNGCSAAVLTVEEKSNGRMVARRGNIHCHKRHLLRGLERKSLE